jgi:MYXO-CTERM domain-containing protein
MKIKVAVVAASATLVGVASAEIVLLDIPSGTGTDIVWASGGGASSMFFDITSENFNFYETGYGSPGVVYAWDEAAVDDDNPWGTNATGVISLFANDPASKVISTLDFQISGYETYASESIVRVYADESLVFTGAFNLAGNSEVETISVAFGESSSVRIELDNTSPWAWTGLDNIAVSSASVPAPGALALLGLAGIVGGRRRRSA